MQTDEKILNRLIINGEDIDKKRQEQFEEQKSQINELKDEIHGSRLDRNGALSTLISVIENISRGSQGTIVSNTGSLRSILLPNSYKIVNSLQSIETALYQPVTITDPDGKKWTMQREKPTNG